MDGINIKLYTTTLAPSVKVKADIDRLRHILAAKRIKYEEVDLSMDRTKRVDMERGSNGEVKALPQLHVNDQFFGDCNTIQEYIDFNEFDDRLQEFASAAAAADADPAADGELAPTSA